MSQAQTDSTTTPNYDRWCREPVWPLQLAVDLAVGQPPRAEDVRLLEAYANGRFLAEDVAYRGYTDAACDLFGKAERAVIAGTLTATRQSTPAGVVTWVVPYDFQSWRVRLWPEARTDGLSCALHRADVRSPSYTRRIQNLYAEARGEKPGPVPPSPPPPPGVVSRVVQPTAGTAIATNTPAAVTVSPAEPSALEKAFSTTAAETPLGFGRRATPRATAHDGPSFTRWAQGTYSFDDGGDGTFEFRSGQRIRSFTASAGDLGLAHKRTGTLGPRFDLLVAFLEAEGRELAPNRVTVTRALVRKLREHFQGWARSQGLMALAEEDPFPYDNKNGLYRAAMILRRQTGGAGTTARPGARQR